jgi:hypothetical protein
MLPGIEKLGGTGLCGARIAALRDHPQGDHESSRRVSRHRRAHDRARLKYLKVPT